MQTNLMNFTDFKLYTDTSSNKFTHIVAENIQTRSAKVDGVVIENHFGIVHLVDQSGESEIMLNSEKLKQIQKMNLDELVVFKVKITDSDSFKRIDVSDIITIDEAKELSK